MINFKDLRDKKRSCFLCLSNLTIAQYHFPMSTTMDIEQHEQQNCGKKTQSDTIF